MTINNYDLSSTGVNIDLTIGKDSFLGQDRFNENFTRIEDNTYLYIDYGNLSNDFIVTITEEDNEKLKKIVIDNDLNYNYDSDNLETCQYIDCITENYNNIELYEFCLNNYIEIEERYKTISISGYSQGDYATVIVNTKECKKVWENEFIKAMPNYSDYFVNLFYNQPLYCSIVVNDIDYYVEFEDEYKYYDSKVIEEIINWSLKNIEVDNKDLLKEQLTELLPTDLY